jgi:transposase
LCGPVSTAAAREKNGQQAIGRSKGGLSTKIHASVDVLSHPLGVHLSAGQASDLEGADVLRPRLHAPILMADKGDDADERVIEPLTEGSTQAVIPPRSHRHTLRTYDRVLHQARHWLEDFFATLKPRRCLATRSDKPARNFLAALHLTASVICLI